jgi:hypothetical protein
VIRRATKLHVRNLYAFACGYCGITEADVGAELTIDHFRPLAHGGKDDDANLVYCCFACNTFKGDAWDPIGPNVLHPLADDITQHITHQVDGHFRPLTALGERHIATLQLNREPLVRRRRAQVITADMLRRQQAVENRIESIESTLVRLAEEVQALNKRRRQ